MPNPYEEALKDDTRFCYGANCTWFGSIHEVSNTKEHPHHKSRPQPDDFGLPCCPVCGGMLFETQSESEWWDQVDKFERGDYPSQTRHPHPGYREMLEWQKRGMFCYKGVPELVKHYQQATGNEIDIEE